METIGIGIFYFIIVTGAGAAVGMVLFHWSERMVHQLSLAEAGNESACGRQKKRKEKVVRVVETEYMDLEREKAIHGRVVIPAGASILAAASVFFFGITMTTGVVFAASLVLLAVAFIDFRCMEIPYRLNFLLLGLGGMSILLMPGSWQSHLAGAVVISIPMLLANVVVQDSFGGGDVFLTASAGLLLGWKGIAAGTMIGMIAAGMYGAGLLLCRRKGPKDHFAFGPFLAAGILLMLFGTSPLLSVSS